MTMTTPQACIHLRGAAAFSAASVLAAASLFAPSAQATIGSPDSASSAGDLTNLSYGSTGNVFEFHPFLYIQGLSLPAAPPSVTALNPALSFGYSISGLGTDLATVTYTIHNGSASSSFDKLRFWVVVNPDGDQNNFIDRVTQNWGGATLTGPVAREADAADGDPFSSIGSRAISNNGLTDSAPSAACAAATGCDAAMAMQWNADHLLAGQNFTIRVGLSDDGRTLSSRSLTAHAVDNLATNLTLSGFSTVATIPEPSSWALFVAGIAGISSLASRRRRANSDDGSNT
jgi:hypothetical protein